MIDRLVWYAILIVMGLLAVSAHGQSNSLYVMEEPEPVQYDVQNSDLSPAIAQYSLLAVLPPEPRQFAVEDLIIIIIRESTKAKSTAELETEKEVTLKGEIPDFPRLTLSDLLDLQLQASENDNPPKLGLSYKNEFEAEAEYKREDSITGRITARIIDIKPNGNLVIEARKYIEQDDETLTIMLNGTCRSDDVTVDNTILSTELYDLRLTKEHTGELRKTTKKGLLTKVLELIFNF